jgi:hypothetical protein
MSMNEKQLSNVVLPWFIPYLKMKPLDPMASRKDRTCVTIVNGREGTSTHRVDFSQEFLSLHAKNIEGGTRDISIMGARLVGKERFHF